MEIRFFYLNDRCPGTLIKDHLKNRFDKFDEVVLRQGDEKNRAIATLRRVFFPEGMPLAEEALAQKKPSKCRSYSLIDPKALV